MINEMRKLGKELFEQRKKQEKHSPYFNLLRNQISGNPSHNQADNRPENIQGLYAKMSDAEKGEFRKALDERSVFLETVIAGDTVKETDKGSLRTSLKDTKAVAAALGFIQETE